MKRDLFSTAFILFLSGEIVVTLLSFAVGGIRLWYVAQIPLVGGTLVVAGMLYSSKYRDES